MVFASLIFLYIFLPLNLILYYVTKNAMYRNIMLTVFSFVFYAWGEPVWILLLVGSALIDWLNALWVDKSRGTKWAKAGVWSSVIFNIGLLVLFKYSGFLYENINNVFGLALAIPAFALPVGISFKVFQTISYVVDVYRGEIRTQKSFLKYMMFVSLYHHLVAGPIVRYAHIAHEVDNRRFKIKDISAGISRFCIGLFKKVCIANVAGEFVMKYMDGNLGTISSLEAWFGVIMFSVQIYFDFSGYSDMAIGLGKMFGFHYKENFNYPYIANSATDFWRRWHISLGTFFRDYIYIPLGGNKKRWILNLFIVWFLTGLWHGASWNFILWGLYFGVLIFFERLFLQKVLNKLGRFVSHVYLLFVAVIGWTLFHFTDFSRLKQYVGIMFGNTPHPNWSLSMQLVLQENMFWIALAFILCMPVYKYSMRFVRWVLRFDRYQIIWAKVWLMTFAFNFGVLFVCTALLAGKSYNPFIYYRF
ncbi:MAG TPA: MBOAT family O-acyltransferase [Bacteroidia bacterium]|nr:MBOAT family O-acyltransferase [Bacteroidia bacterium]